MLKFYLDSLFLNIGLSTKKRMGKYQHLLNMKQPSFQAFHLFLIVFFSSSQSSSFLRENATQNNNRGKTIFLEEANYVC